MVVSVTVMGDSLGREETTKRQAKASRPFSLASSTREMGDAPQFGEIEWIVSGYLNIAHHAITHIQTGRAQYMYPVR